MASTPAVKALSRHLKELHEHPLPGIDASPSGDVIFNWCGNVFFPEGSPYAGLVVHFHLDFDGQYPSTSPQLKLCTTIDHTHVFGSSCCFSLLPDFRGYFEAINLAKSAYWSSARTVRNFLEGFYQFLVYDVDRESHGRGDVSATAVKTALDSSKAFKCTKCKHTFSAPVPAKPTITEDEANKYQDDNNGSQPKTEADQALADLCCSVTRMNINETIMGFGVQVTQGKSLSIVTDLFPLSYQAFYEDKIRLSAGGLTITHWIPFAINEENWKKAFPIAKESISLIMGNDKSRFFPSYVLDVIGELWKTKAVEMMKNEEHASEKVLIGFCAFHHLLLAFAQSIPELVDIATKDILSFISSPNKRNKNACPDFGRFLPKFLISNVLWEDEKHAGRVCVSELFTRNAMWIIKQQKDLEDPTIDNGRITRSWEPSQVGLKLTCFQIRYLLEVGRPNEETDLAANYARFNALYGRPSAKMIEDFQKTTKKVQAIDNYGAWFGAMGLGVPPKDVVLDMLQEAMVNSEKQGYHKRGGNSGGGGRGGYNNNNRGGRRY